MSRREIGLALKNALRYVPEKWHELLAPEFLDELLATPYMELTVEEAVTAMTINGAAALDWQNIIAGHC